MKKASLLLLCLCIALISKAQDVITLTNGTIIHAQVLQVTPAQIIYKDNNNPDGPKLAVRKSGVATLQYASGRKIIYNLIADTHMPGNNGKVDGWYFGIALSGGTGTVTSNDPTYSVGGTTFGGVNFFATAMINQHFGIQFGMGADGYGYDVNYNSKSLFPVMSDVLAQRYLNLPLRVLYLSNSKRRVGVYATAGLDFSIVESATNNEGAYLVAYYRDLIISPYVSCGVVLRNANARGIWMLGPFFQQSITNIYSANPVYYEGTQLMGPGNTGNFTSMGITLSFMTNFSKWY